MHILRNDRVVLLKDVTYTESRTERDEEQKQPSSNKGETGRVLRVLRDSGQVIIEGVNFRKKAVRPSQDNPRGGWLTKEMPIDISNVALFCPECGRGVRVRNSRREDGVKERLCSRAGHVIPLP